MVCPKCGKDGLEAGDAFCRHCGFSLAAQASVSGSAVNEKKPVARADSDAGKGLQYLGGAIFVVTAILAPAVMIAVGVPQSGASVLPWVSGSLMLVGLGLAYIGTKMRHAR